MRGADRSKAVTCAPKAANCIVLPPGAAHRSSTVSPGCGARIRTGRAAAASCTHHSPSAYPGNSDTCPASLSLTDPVGKTCPPNSAATALGSCRAVRSSAAPAKCAASIATTALRPQASTNGPRSQFGKAGAGKAAQAPGPAAATLRKTALTSPFSVAVRLPRPAICTMSLTTPCAAAPWAISTVPRRRILRIVSGGALVRNGFSIRSARSSPRKVWVASRCARARSSPTRCCNAPPATSSAISRPSPVI